ncbi:hypothetical protein AB0L65_20060 [Nonomuraea sp. NPDC052116]|uniref:hypothetical protein n=1 Tax=Nonomuraea sp. NPDC052116 TaxID=3155665 RepID=UPI0034267554
MTGTERSSEPDPFADEGGRRGRILMIAGALVGTLMLASAGILVGGASTARRLDAVDWHRTGPGARDGSIPVATESRLRTAPTTLGPARTALGPSASPARSPSAHPAHSAAAAHRPTPKAHPTPRRTNSTRPTPASVSRTPTPEPATASPAVRPTRSSTAPPPTAATPPGRTHVPPGQTRHPRKH